jgi:hypothetical protein
MAKQELAKQLFDNGLVQRLDKDHFLVSEKSYEVERTPNKPYEFYCKCPAWKFDSEHDCKHCIAVRLFEKNGN